MPNSVKRMASFLSTDKERQCAQLEELLSLVEGESAYIGRRPRISTRTIAIGALLVSLFLPSIVPLGDIVGLARAFRGPAMGLHEVKLVTPVVRLGEPMIIKTRSQYLRACLWQWTLEWRRADGKPIAIQQHFGSAHVIGAISEHDIPLELPRGIQPGNYIYHESATADCGHGDVAQIIDPDMPFTITN